MGNTQKTGNYVNAISQDSSNNIGIGAAPSGSYKFEVTGTSKVSGVLTLGSTLSDGTYTYTLPSATGTLALTSALGDYVTLATTQTITGLKNFDLGINIKHGIFPLTLGYTGIGAQTNGLIINVTGGGFGVAHQLLFSTANPPYTYTFPSADGTLALTSNLSSYLPLTGGTLTGALGGTSASFSGVLTVTNSSATPVIVTSTAATSTFALDNTNANLWGGVYAVKVNGVDKNYFGTLGSLLGTTNTDATIWATSGNGFRVYTNGNNNRLQVFSNGGVGINTGGTDAGYQLDVNGTGRFSGVLRVDGNTDPNSAAAAFFWNQSFLGPTISGFNFEVRTGNTGAQARRLFVNETGAATFSSSVGIGLATGTGKLYAKQSTLNFYDGINCYASTNDSFTGIGHTGSLGAVFSSYNVTAGAYTPLAFFTSDVERMRITSGGNVLIGTTTDGGQKLQVNGTIKNLATHTNKGVIAVPNNTPTTLYTFTTYGLYIFYSDLINGGGVPTLYSSYAIIAFDGAVARIMQQTNGSAYTLTLSGNSIQATQTSGITQNCNYIFELIGA